jgi:hypothetical protein
MKGWNALPIEIRLTIIAVGVIGGGFAIWKLSQGLKGGISRLLGDKEAREAKDELALLAKEGIYPTLSDFQITQMVNTLVYAMGGCDAQEEVMFAEFNKLQNQADWVKLALGWGVQKVDDCNWAGQFGDSNLTLSETIVQKLYDDDINQIRNILFVKGINIGV